MTTISWVSEHWPLLLALWKALLHLPIPLPSVQVVVVTSREVALLVDGTPVRRVPIRPSVRVTDHDL